MHALMGANSARISPASIFVILVFFFLFHLIHIDVACRAVLQHHHQVLQLGQIRFLDELHRRLHLLHLLQHLLALSPRTLLVNVLSVLLDLKD